MIVANSLAWALCLLLFLLLLLVITFIDGIYKYTLGTLRFSRVYKCCHFSIVTIYSTCNFYFPCWMFCTVTLVIFEIGTNCPVWLFCVCLDAVLSGNVVQTFSERHLVTSFVPVFTGITFIYTFHIWLL
jgi:hypothetical protein